MSRLPNENPDGRKIRKWNIFIKNTLTLFSIVTSILYFRKGIDKVGKLFEI